MPELLLIVTCIAIAILFAAPLGVAFWKSNMRAKWKDLEKFGWKPYES